MHRLFLAAALSAIACQVIPALGAVNPISQSRRVETFASYSPAGGEFGFSSDRFDAPGFGEWTGNALCHVGEEGAQANSAADMVSTIDETGLFISAATSASAEVRVPEDFAEAIGISRITYVFSVDTPTPCHVVVNAVEQGNGRFNFLLRVQGGPFLIFVPSEDVTVSIDELVELAPGSYELTASSDGFGQAFGGTSTIAAVDYSIAFTVLSPASVPSSPAALAPMVQPNPLTDRTTISLQNTFVSETVQVIDVAGRLVRRLQADGGAVQWDGRDEAGQQVTGGIYYVRAGRSGAARVVVLR